MKDFVDDQILEMKLSAICILMTGSGEESGVSVFELEKNEELRKLLMSLQKESVALFGRGLNEED